MMNTTYAHQRFSWSHLFLMPAVAKVGSARALNQVRRHLNTCVVAALCNVSGPSLVLINTIALCKTSVKGEKELLYPTYQEKRWSRNEFCSLGSLLGCLSLLLATFPPGLWNHTSHQSALIEVSISGSVAREAQRTVRHCCPKHGLK